MLYRQQLRDSHLRGGLAYLVVPVEPSSWKSQRRNLVESASQLVIDYPVGILLGRELPLSLVLNLMDFLGTSRD